jgi:hypothetical protein
MNTLWERLYFLLSKEKREEWAKRYKKRFNKEFIPPERDERDMKVINLETKLEVTSEIAELMKQAPNYSIDVQGREQ